MEDKQRESMEFDSQLYCQSGKLTLGFMKYSLACYVSKSKVGKKEFNYNLVVMTMTKYGFHGYGSWDFVINVAIVVLMLWVVMEVKVRQIQKWGWKSFHNKFKWEN
jgi:hypothetical protein